MSNASESRAKAVAEAARRKVEWRYAKIETQKMVELKMKECEIEEMQRKKNYERAETEAAALAKVAEEEKKQFTPDSLDNVPAVVDNEDWVRQYLSTLPVDPVHSIANSSADQPNNPASVTTTQIPSTTVCNQSPDPPAIYDGSPGVKPSTLKPTATPLIPVYTQTAMRHSPHQSTHQWTSVVSQKR